MSPAILKLVEVHILAQAAGSMTFPLQQKFQPST